MELKYKNLKGVSRLLRCIDLNNLSNLNLFVFKCFDFNQIKNTKIFICYNKQFFYFVGKLGKIKISFKALGLNVKFNDKLFLLRDKAMLGRLVGLLYQACWGIENGYHTEIELKGLGFGGFVSKNYLFLDLGYCH